MAKRVKFYQSQKTSDGKEKYQVPNDIKDLIDITCEVELMAMIRKRINLQLKKEIKNVEKCSDSTFL